MTELSRVLAGGIAANMYLGTEIVFRLVDVLVAKNVLTANEGASTIRAIAEGIRKDAGDDKKAQSAVHAMASVLEKQAAAFVR
ncbi:MULTISPECIES: hypothetical protein [Agrobacterium]|uniref:hypothetical protein n=1 Tax=Agrobacterium tumefaciens TaxID=358 RepID=UPI0015746F11|nr:hypothetical protein [Agrobacterium tumefaciens]